jgi:hypothetical protein
VREALKDHASSLEEGKADIVGLYAVTKLHEMGELGDADLMDNYVTFMAGLFRSIRFGSASAHGRANLARFAFMARYAVTDSQLEADLQRLEEAGIPTDIVFEQGLEVLGLRR